MPAEVTVEQDGEGRLVVRKVALPGSPGDLAQEAAWLRRASGCGVVEVVAASDNPPALVTLHAGSHTWRTASPDPEAAAVLLAAALRTVAALHRRSLVHGGISADHLIVSGWRVTLCSPRPCCPDAAVDRQALAELATGTAERWRTSSPPVAAPAAWPRVTELLTRPESGWTLDDIADLLDPGGSSHPSTGTAPTRSHLVPAARRWRRALAPTWRMAAAGAVVAVALLGAGLTAQRMPGPGPAVELGGPGSRVDLAGARYRSTGPTGTLAATSRPCPGSPAAALLEPGSGVVWGFGHLPDGPSSVPGVALAQVPGASRLAVVDGEDCQRLVAEGPAGEAVLSGPGSVRTG